MLNDEQLRKVAIACHNCARACKAPGQEFLPRWKGMPEAYKAIMIDTVHKYGNLGRDIGNVNRGDIFIAVIDFYKAELDITDEG